MTRTIISRKVWEEKQRDEDTCGCGYHMPRAMKRWADTTHEVKSSREIMKSTVFKFSDIDSWEFCACLLVDASILKGIYD